MDPADSALTECLEEMARIQAILNRVLTAPDLKSKLVMVNVAEAIMKRDPRLLQLPDSPAIVDAFTRIKEMLQAQELSSHVMASSTSQSQQPHNQLSPPLPLKPECVRVRSLRFDTAPLPSVPAPPPNSPVSSSPSRISHSPSQSHSVFTSPASFLARLWSEDEEPDPTISPASVTTASRKKRQPSWSN